LKVVVYSKQNCCLCDQAKKILLELQKEIPFHFEEIDIYQDDHLLEKYQLMIPVVEMDGEVIEYGIIHKDVIRKRLQRQVSS
jgi:glutaredoxin